MRSLAVACSATEEEMKFFRRERQEPAMTEAEAKTVETLARFYNAAKYLYSAFGAQFTQDDLSERANRLVENPTPKDSVDRGILALLVAMEMVPSSVTRKQLGEID